MLVRINSIVFILVVLFLISSCARKTVPIEVVEQLLLQFDSIRVIDIDKGIFHNAPCEPTICISKVNTDLILAGSVLDNFYKSTDGGLSWTKQKMKSSFGVFGDPVIRTDYTGNFFFSHLSNPKGKAYSSDEFLDRIVVQSTKNNGTTWHDGTYPLVDHSKDHDKQWMYVDPATNDILMSWTEFDKYGSENEADRSRILFSKSTDSGDTWSEAIVISQLEGDCLDSDKTTEGATPMVDKEGNFYVVWSYNDKIYFDVSKDRGKTWQNKDKVIASQQGGWDFVIPGIGRCNGMPVANVDHSAGKFSGSLYVSWSDQRNGVNDTDILIVRSKDNGVTWSAPKRVNDDSPGKHQFFSWMDIDQTTGYLYFVFYDRRNHADNYTDVYLAYSTDGGDTFVNRKISDSPFLAEDLVFFGDYNDISAHDGKIRPIWTDQQKATLTIKTALINVLK